MNHRRPIGLFLVLTLATLMAACTSDAERADNANWGPRRQLIVDPTDHSGQTGFVYGQ